MRSPDPSAAPPRRILLIQLRRLGDVLLTTTLLGDLRRAFPEARVDFLVGRAAAPLLEGQPAISEVLVYDDRHPLREIRRIRARRYDWIVDVQSNPRTAQISLLSRAPVRAGWDIRGLWRLAYTHRLPRRGRPAEYVPRQRQRMLELLGVPVEPARPRLVLAPAEREAGEAEARALGIAPGDDVVGILLSANEPSKQWEPSRFAELAERLRADGLVPLLFHMPGDDARVAEFRARTGAAVVARTPGLRQFLAMLPVCRAFVSGDTGPAHMATALEVPTVTLFGPTNPVDWSPGLPTTVVLRENAGCPSCGKGLGAKHGGHDCLGKIGVDAVHRAVRRLLRETSAAAGRRASSG